MGEANRGKENMVFDWHKKDETKKQNDEDYPAQRSTIHLFQARRV